MKKLFLNLFSLALLSLLAVETNAQINTPAASPGSEVTQTIGLTDVTVEYSRPGVKGRTIFAADGLVPYGKMWRTGANAATKITFSGDVTVGGKELKAGSYAILTKPDAAKWAIHFHPYESGSWGSYMEKDPAAALEVKPEKLPFSVESFTIAFNNLTSNSADLMMYWDETIVSTKIETDVDSKVMADIKRVMAGPSQNDYYAAASYYHESGKDLEKALEYIQMATKEDPKFWQVRREALILADMGKTMEAIKAAEKSKSLAEKAGNEDFVRMNEKSIKEWKMKKGK